MYTLALQNNNQEILRVFHCHVDTVFLVLNKSTGRLDVNSCFNFSEKEKKQFQVIKELKLDELKNSQCFVSEDCYLTVTDFLASKNGEVRLELSSAQDLNKDLYLSASFVASLSAIILFSLWLVHDPKKIQEELPQEQQVVKIIKPIPIIKPEQVAMNTRTNHVRASKSKTIPKKPVKKSLKKMGALAALGSLSKDQTKQKSGLNLGASVTSAGPGLRSLLSSSKGSGGVQSSVYSKGMITEALGSGGNIKGGGGYGTRGTASGGGQAGYGKLALVGSGGTADLSESSSLSLEGGSFDMSLIEREILKHIGQIRHCYDKALKTTPDLSGVFISHILISQKGRVASAKLHKNSKVRAQQISSCILAVLSKIRFKNVVVNEGLLSIVYPFDLAVLN